MAALLAHTPAAARVFHCGDAVLVAEIGCLCVAIWRRKPMRDTFGIQKACLDKVVRLHPRQAGFLCIIERTADPPDDDLRRASSEMVTGHGTNLKLVAGVIEGDGFRAAVTRSVLSGIMRFVRTAAPVRFFESASAASGWITEAIDVGSAEGLSRQIEDLRRQTARA